MGWVEDKIKLFSNNIAAYAGTGVRDKVMPGGGELNAESGYEGLTAWMEGAVERLLASVDEETARKIFVQNACRFVEETFMGDTGGELAKLRELYKKNKNIYEVIRMMNRDNSFNGRSMFPRYEYNNGVLYNTKNACNVEEFEKAETPYDKQKAYCFCPFAKVTRGKIPKLYCNCGAAFNKYIWEGIVDGEVNVEVVESIISGGRYCTFAIYLPR